MYLHSCMFNIKTFRKYEKPGGSVMPIKRAYLLCAHSLISIHVNVPNFSFSGTTFPVFILEC